MKTITLKQEMAIMHGTRGMNIAKPYAVNGNHFSSLKSAIVDAKKIVLFGNGINHCHIMTTRENVRFKTVATVTNHDFEFVEIVFW